MQLHNSKETPYLECLEQNLLAISLSRVLNCPLGGGEVVDANNLPHHLCTLLFSECRVKARPAEALLSGFQTLDSAGTERSA